MAEITMMDGSASISVPLVQRPDRVRIAETRDRAHMWEQLRLAAAENAMAPVYDDCVDAVLDNMLSRTSSIAGIIDGTTAIAGSVGLAFDRWWYSREYHVSEMWCYVHPDYRRGSQNKGHLNALLDFAIWWADQMGLPLLMGVLTDKRMEGKIKLYQRRIPMKGALFLHRPGIV